MNTVTKKTERAGKSRARLSLLSCLLALVMVIGLFACFGVSADSSASGAEGAEPEALTLSEGEHYRFYRSKHNNDDSKYRIVCVVDEAWLSSPDKTTTEVYLTVTDQAGKSETKSAGLPEALYRRLTARDGDRTVTYLPQKGALLFGWILTDIPAGCVPTGGRIEAQKDPAAMEDITAYDAENWMSALPGNLRLSQISIPGTHDTGATMDDMGSGWWQCQDKTIAEQLALGVRYLDIRCRRENNQFAIYHGIISQGHTFDDVLSQVIAFLTAHPGEAVIMCVKEEGDAAANTPTPFDEMMQRYIDQNPDFWYLGNDIPTLSEARGKIVLMRRYGTSKTHGFNASSGWADNTTFRIYNGAWQLWGQDYYQNSDADAKWEAVSSFYKQMRLQSNRYYLNFTSGNIMVNIPAVSNVINPKLIDYLKTNPGFVGITAVDFVTEEIAALIYGQNFVK